VQKDLAAVEAELAFLAESKGIDAATRVVQLEQQVLTLNERKQQISSRLAGI
jgi:hypothetical protein